MFMIVVYHPVNPAKWVFVWSMPQENQNLFYVMWAQNLWFGALDRAVNSFIKDAFF